MILVNFNTSTTMKSMFRLCALGLLTVLAGACNDTIEEATTPVQEWDGHTIRMEVSQQSASRAVVKGQNEEGDWLFAFEGDDDMVLLEVASVSSRGYNHVRMHQPTQSNVTAQEAAFTYSISDPYKVGAAYPGTSTYTTEAVYYTGILPASGFAGFYANYPVGAVDPTVTNASEGFMRVNVPRVQKPTATSPDPAAILLRAYDSELPADGVMKTRFKHMLAYMKITVKGLPVDFKFNQLNISGIALCNSHELTNKSYQCKYKLSGFESNAAAGKTLVIDTSDLTPDENGCYTVWAACMPYSGVTYPTVQFDQVIFSPYETTNAPLASKSVPISKSGGDVEGTRTIALNAGVVSSFTLNYGYGNDLSQPVVKAETESIDAERSTVTFSWDVNEQADHYVYKVNDGAEQTTTAQKVTLTVAPGTKQSIAVKAVPAADSGFAASGWGTASITSAYYRVKLQQPEVKTATTSYSTQLSWDAVANAVGYSYKIGETGAVVNVGNVLTYTIEGLQADTDYTIFVRALAEANSTAWTDSAWTEVSVRTGSKSALVMGAVTVSEVTDRSAVVSWGAVTGATGYRYRLNGDDATIATLASGGKITGLKAETAYTVQVQAIAATASDWSDSAWSEAVSFTTTAAVGPLYSWGSDEFAAWSSAIGSTSLMADSEYAGLGYYKGSDGKGYNFVTDANGMYINSIGNGDNGKNYFYFTATGSGRLTITGHNGKTSAKTIRVMLKPQGSSDKGSTVSEPSIAASADFSVSVDITAAEGDQIQFAPRDSNISFYTISWEPAQ